MVLQEKHEAVDDPLPSPLVHPPGTHLKRPRVCAWCRHTRGFQRVTHHTHHNTTTTPHRDRHRERDIERRGDEREEDKRIEERREKIHFQCGGAGPFLVGVVKYLENSVCARDLSFLNSVKYDSSLFSFSVPWPVNSFLISEN